MAPAVDVLGTEEAEARAARARLVGERDGIDVTAPLAVRDELVPEDAALGQSITQRRFAVDGSE